MMRATGFDPRQAGLGRVMTDARDARLYSVFGGSRTDQYERSVEAVEEQKLCFMLALERGLMGPLVERFKTCFRTRGKEKLLDKFLMLYPPGTVPVELREPLMRILGEAVSRG